MKTTLIIEEFESSYKVTLIVNERKIDWMTCEKEEDIQWCFREMLRWYDKAFSPLERLPGEARRNHRGMPLGRVWYANKQPFCPNSGAIHAIEFN